MKRTIEFEVAAPAIVSRGVEVTVQLADLSDAILTQLALHGLRQKVGDAASQASTAACETHFGSADYNKADAKAWLELPQGQKAVAEMTKTMMQKAIDALLAGEWSMRQGSGVVKTQDEVTKLAHDKAKAQLMETFKRAALASGVKATIANMVGLSPAIAKYFSDKNKWQEPAVAAYVASQLEAGKRDFRAEAVAELNAIREAASEIDMEDLLDGL